MRCSQAFYSEIMIDLREIAKTVQRGHHPLLQGAPSSCIFGNYGAASAPRHQRWYNRHTCNFTFSDSHMQTEKKQI